MQGIDHALRRLERIRVLAAALMLFAIVSFATIDVAMRYLFNAPLSWSDDLISLYLMGGVFFLSLSDTLAHDGRADRELAAGVQTEWAESLNKRRLPGSEALEAFRAALK